MNKETIDNFMEQVDYKEKYEEIIKNLKEAKKSMGGYTFSSVVDKIIPEFKESEDEKMIRNIIEFLRMFSPYEMTRDGTTIGDILAWLEKQREQKQHLELKAGHWYFCYQAYCERADILTVKEGEVFKCEKDGIVKGLIIKEPEKYFKEISTPSDIIEPKFKVGDWITNNRNVWCIETIHDGLYDLKGTHGCVMNNLKSKTIDDKFHLWTIQDAKDGDVLVCEGKISKDKYGQEIGIVKKYVGRIGGCDNCFETYCFIDWEGNFRVSEAMGSPNIHPSTEEQYNLLFSKMKEAGYEWDAEKKELRKIEQKPTTWNEEDEKHLLGCVNYFSGITESSPYYNDFLWLKSLKERIK